MQHTRRQWMVSHEWMVKPMKQTEWIQGQGILIWLAEVASALGTGLYLVSIFVNNWWGALIGWFIVVGIKLPLHFIYLGKPFRFWRALPPFTRAWRTSWIARGFFFTTLYSGVGLLQLATSYLILNPSGLSSSALSTIFVIDVAVKILAGILIILTAVYNGFMMSFCKSVPFWNTGLLPIVILNAGIADGMALMIGIGLYSGGVDVMALEGVTRILLLVNIILIGTYLLNATYGADTAKLSAKELLLGKNAIPFWVGLVILGITLPLAISLAPYFVGEVSHSIQIFAIVCHTAGAFALKYCILNVGYYKPLLYSAMRK
jgi:formate-dependent nitrite reductase membrane component NrfD